MVHEAMRLSFGGSPAPWYDTEINDSYRSVSPQPRVKPEGEEYAIRNRGSIGKWAFNYNNGQYNSPRPIPRCPTSDSQNNYEVGRHGTIRRLLYGTATPRPDTAPPRIKSEAEPIASLSRGKRMKIIINEFAKKGPTPRVARVKQEAEGHAEVHKGGRMDKLIHSFGQLPLSDRGCPRVKVEGEPNADLDKGKRMEKLVTRSLGGMPKSARAVPRVKTEGEDNANLDKGKRMQRLVNEYGRTPISSRAVPRVKTEGDPNYKLDMGKRMATLMHEVKKYPSSPCLAPRVRSSEANAIMIQHRGQVGRVLRATGKKTCIHKPGVQKTQYSQAQTV